MGKVACRVESRKPKPQSQPAQNVDKEKTEPCCVKFHHLPTKSAGLRRAVHEAPRKCPGAQQLSFGSLAGMDREGPRVPRRQGSKAKLMSHCARGRADVVVDQFSGRHASVADMCACVCVWRRKNAIATSGEHALR